MQRYGGLLLIGAILGSSMVGSVQRVAAQQAERNPALIANRNEIEQELESAATVERKVMIRMRDGKRMAADIYRPKDETKKYATIFLRTPYDFNYWDIALGAPRDMNVELEAVKRGYAYVEINERGRFFSEGNWDILGAPVTDGYDEFSWIASQPWSNGKVGAIGCSSTAEWQLAVTALGNPAEATFIPMGFGAGVGRVGPYYEQGNWYRGGAVQMLFIDWLYGMENEVRPMFPVDTSREELIRTSRGFDLSSHFPPVNWTHALWHLPEKDIIAAVDGPKGIFADYMPVPAGGGMIERYPNDPAWYKGGLWNDSMKINVPGLWFMSWYDISIDTNIAAYNFVRETAKPEIANQEYAVIAPTAHCGYEQATEHTLVGELDMGDARLDVSQLTYSWFDHFLKGEENHILETQPRIRYFVMGANRWERANTWPPEGSQTMTFYLSSEGHANSIFGDGVLASAPPSTDETDHFTYDPANPVLSHSGMLCCNDPAFPAGSFDQRQVETRNDILIYTTKPFEKGMEIAGPIAVTLYVSSDAKDTDFTVKLIDVYPNGSAYNLNETIQRMRYRNGYDQPVVWMVPGQVYRVAFQPMQTSDFIAPGHALRVEISSSNFPRFDRNLNTGGNNYSEIREVIAHNCVHHSNAEPSRITVQIVPHPHPSELPIGASRSHP